MVEYDLQTDVAVFIYNRPDHFQRVLDVITEVEPPTLYVIGDGPKTEDDIKLCKESRELITDIEMDFEVKTNFSDENLGIKERFTTGLNWVFEKTPEAIILEDDIVPKMSFFKYCDILLERFRGDDRVMEISGRNHLETWQQNGYDYHFSNYGGIWGWATWKDAWEKYDKSMALWDSDVIKNCIRDVIANDSQYQYQKHVYEMTSQGDIDTWDYQWGFAKNLNNALSIVPSKNLTENIGFDEVATHTTNKSHPLGDKKSFELTFPLNHPPFVAPDREYDRQFHNLRNQSIFERVVNLITNKFEL